MKKVSILSTSLLLIFLGACMFNFISDKNVESKIKKHIELQNENSIEWFNSGQIDKLIEDYALNACFYRNGHAAYCGKEEIRSIMQLALSAKAFKLFDIQLISLKVDGDLAVEKSLTSSTLQTGEIIKTINIQEWRNIDNKWLIVNDIDVVVTNDK